MQMKKNRDEKGRLVVVICVFFCFAGNGTTGREEGQKLRRTHHFSGISGGAWLHAPPGTVARWNTRRQHSCARIPAVSVVPLQISGVLRTVL
jgi:hypothetical protein